TLADSTVLPAEQRLAALHCWQQQLGGTINVAALAEIESQLVGKLQNPDEARLLQQLPQLFALLEQQSAADRALIEKVVTTLTGGMIYDLTTFPMEESGEVLALQSWDELHHYTYREAGCVGEFWTEISIAHLPPLHHWQQHHAQLGIRFGKGLQLTNILRDLPRDLRLGRCYLPQSLLQQHGLSVAMLLDRRHSVAARPLLNVGIEQALAHFAVATQYVIAIPRRCLRLRLAALWPLLIGLATLERLATRSDEWLDVDHVAKVERQWVYRMILLSLLCVASNSLVRFWVRRLVGKISR
ncbi:MAG: squalene/phytoene synthase family protein, partial [Pseudomonadota bacterium]|nr:squalene/phytoene synthase family protein [Pseudomonadota bacterium]